MKYLWMLVAILLVGCIPPPKWSVIKQTEVYSYNSSCVRQSILSVEGVIGTISMLPSQSYSITGEAIPRLRQFVIETELGNAHLHVRSADSKIELSAVFEGYKEKPSGIETEGAKILENIINAIENDCGRNI